MTLLASVHIFDLQNENTFRFQLAGIIDALRQLGQKKKAGRLWAGDRKRTVLVLKIQPTRRSLN